MPVHRTPIDGPVADGNLVANRLVFLHRVAQPKLERGLVLAFPVYFMLVTSLKTSSEAYRLPATLWPRQLTFDAYPFVIKAWNYWQTLANTVFVAGTASLGATMLGGVAAYGFSRMEFTGKSLLYATVVGSMAIPAMVTLGPIFLAYKDFRLLDTHLGLVLIFMAGGIPVAFLTLFSYFKAITKELDEASSIDGCSLIDTFFRIIMPVALPGFAVTFLLLFIAGWNEFLFAFTLTITPDTRPAYRPPLRECRCAPTPILFRTT